MTNEQLKFNLSIVSSPNVFLSRRRYPILFNYFIIGSKIVVIVGPLILASEHYYPSLIVNNLPLS